MYVGIAAVITVVALLFAKETRDRDLANVAANSGIGAEAEPTRTAAGS